MDISIDELNERIGAGDREAAAQVLELLLPQLIARANALLWKQAEAAQDAEDAAMSALRTFVRRWRLGEYQGVKDVESLLRLLATIACRKALRLRQRRSRQADAYAMLQPHSDGSHHPIEGLLAVMPTQECDVLCGELLSILPDDQHRELVMLCLAGYTQQEIAQRWDCSDRSVRYKLKTVRNVWKRVLEMNT